MELISIDCEEVRYPVGDHMDTAISFTRVVSNYLRKENLQDKFINLICTGSSGAILSALIYADLLNDRIAVCHLKKNGETSHSGSSITFMGADTINIIIDDFGCTGRTLSNIMKKFREISFPDTQID